MQLPNLEYLSLENVKTNKPRPTQLTTFILKNVHIIYRTNRKPEELHNNFQQKSQVWLKGKMLYIH